MVLGLFPMRIDSLRVSIPEVNRNSEMMSNQAGVVPFLIDPVKDPRERA